ncbi:MAG TPA: DUF2007 domain-containing protein [Thermoanaerobaculia bacterium]|jgi:hypothetical protein
MAEERENVNTIRADDGTTWVEIASCGTADEANLLRGFLEAEGIPAQIENVSFSMEPINFGTMGDIRIYVSDEDKAQALALLKQRGEEFDNLDDDGETVVTDEGTADIADDVDLEGESKTEVS